MRRLAGAAFIAFLVLAVAVTPLSATFQKGYFELWLPSTLMGPTPHVVLFDDTGNVRALLPTAPTRLVEGVSPTSGHTREIAVAWLGGCGDGTITLHLFRSPNGYSLTEQTNHDGCQLLIGVGRQFTLLLYSPIDASTVDFTGTDVVPNAP